MLGTAAQSAHRTRMLQRAVVSEGARPFQRMSVVSTACPLNCALCPARARCGGVRNFCGQGVPMGDSSCTRCVGNSLLDMSVREAVVRHLRHIRDVGGED